MPETFTAHSLPAQSARAALIRFIEAHDGCKVEQVCTGRLEVSSLAVIEGSACRVYEQIDADMQAARRWLGC